MKRLLVLGSTGSIGTQTLDVVRANPGALQVEGLAAQSSWEALLEQVREFQPRFVAVADREAATRIAAVLPSKTALFAGDDAVLRLCREAEYETAVHGIVGAAGLAASVAVLERGRQLALANKESLVVAGHHLTALAEEHGGTILPVDSELCAIHQCLRGERRDRIRRIVLTASGGPFRDADPDTLARATPEQALAHPNWDMGPRISIGSATLMNKALELLEVRHLFGVEADRITVAIHRQSIVHSMVEFVDSSVIAQLGPPDMRAPLHYCLFHPERAPADLPGFDFESFAHLTFEAPDPQRFPALELGFRCLEQGSDSGAVLNAADEVAVEAFLDGTIRFSDIAEVNARTLARRPGWDADVDALLRADGRARELAREDVARISRTAPSAS